MSERPASFTGDVLKVQGGGVTIIVLHKSNRVIFERRNNFWNIYPADGIIYFDMVMSNVYIIEFFPSIFIMKHQTIYEKISSNT